MTINISLPAEMEARVREHVASGLYGSASEVVREALRLFESYQSVRASTLVALKTFGAGLLDRHQGMSPQWTWRFKAEGGPEKPQQHSAVRLTQCPHRWPLTRKPPACERQRHPEPRHRVHRQHTQVQQRSGVMSAPSC